MATATTKNQSTVRKGTIDAFFSSSFVSRKRKLDEVNLDFDIRHKPEIPGLSVISNFVTRAEEQDLLCFLSKQTWRTDLSRRCMHYGGTYCLLPPRDASPDTRARIEKDIRTADPIPEELNIVIHRMVENGLYAAHERPQFCIVNEYTSTQGISAHVENFRFAEPVCALTLESGDFMRFHELVQEDDGSVRSGRAQLAERTGKRKDVWLPARSLLVMRGDARRKWQHEIVRGKKRQSPGFRRVSLTFRLERGRSRDERQQTRSIR